MKSFYDTLTEAVSDVVEHGFDSEDRIRHWQEELRRAAEQSTRSTTQLNQMMEAAMRAIYHRMVDKYGAVRYHPGIQRWNIERIRPELRSELQRRIMAAASLIRLNRDEAISSTLRRFEGWATSIPAGGTDRHVKTETKDRVKKSLAGLPFEVRRVSTDQGHKLVASINDIIAHQNEAIAVVWHSHWRQPGYNYRRDHKERDGHIYVIRGSWAIEQGLMKSGPHGYYDEITAVGEEVYCRCYATYVYTLGRLPVDMLTEKGRDELRRARGTIGTSKEG